MAKDAEKLTKTIRRLRRLERDWPSGYILFANSSGGNVILCEGHPQDGGKAVDTFQIPADGGDPDWAISADNDSEKMIGSGLNSAIQQLRFSTKDSVSDRITPMPTNLKQRIWKSIKVYECADRRKCEHPRKRYYCSSCGIFWFNGWLCPLCRNFGVVRYG
jgi:hypothetical protein